MGWSSGSEIGEKVWETIKKFIPEDQKPKIAKKIYDEFCAYDADDWVFEKNNLYFYALQINDPKWFAECLEDIELEESEEE